MLGFLRHRPQPIPVKPRDEIGHLLIFLSNTFVSQVGIGPGKWLENASKKLPFHKRFAMTKVIDGLQEKLEPWTVEHGVTWKDLMQYHATPE